MPGTYNSGRNNRSAARHEGMRRLTLAHLRRRKLLQAGFGGIVSWSCDGENNGSVLYRTHHGYSELIWWTQGGDEKKLRLDHRYSATNFGGQRLWFACPGCYRSCGILYFGAGTFRCRQCFRITYASQYDRRHERPRRKAAKIRARLGQITGAPDCEAFPPKPKLMRWATYRALKAADRQYCRAFDAAWGEWAVGKFAGAFGRLSPSTR
jgi:hypothetical protein